MTDADDELTQLRARVAELVESVVAWKTMNGRLCEDRDAAIADCAAMRSVAAEMPCDECDGRGMWRCHRSDCLGMHRCEACAGNGVRPLASNAGAALLERMRLAEAEIQQLKKAEEDRKAALLESLRPSSRPSAMTHRIERERERIEAMGAVVEAARDAYEHLKLLSFDCEQDEATVRAWLIEPVGEALAAYDNASGTKETE